MVVKLDKFCVKSYFHRKRSWFSAQIVQLSAYWSKDWFIKPKSLFCSSASSEPSMLQITNPLNISILKQQWRQQFTTSFCMRFFRWLFTCRTQSEMDGWAGEHQVFHFHFRFRFQKINVIHLTDLDCFRLSNFSSIWCNKTIYCSGGDASSALCISILSQMTVQMFFSVFFRG